MYKIAALLAGIGLFLSGATTTYLAVADYIAQKQYDRMLNDTEYNSTRGEDKGDASLNTTETNI